MLTPNNWRKFQISHSLLLLSVVAKVQTLEPTSSNVDLEPVWKCTNSYICSIINDVFFSEFKPFSISRDKIAKCIFLDFTEHWLLAHPSLNPVIHVPQQGGLKLSRIKNVTL